MYCTNCGRKMEDDELFCIECGAPAEPDGDDTQVLSESLTDSDDTQDSPDAFSDSDDTHDSPDAFSDSDDTQVLSEPLLQDIGKETQPVSQTARGMLPLLKKNLVPICIAVVFFTLGFLAGKGVAGRQQAVSDSDYAVIITQQPESIIAKKGDTITFTVEAEGNNLEYQWQISDDGGKTWRDSAVKTAQYTTTLADNNNGRLMRCVVSDQSGYQVTSEAASMKTPLIEITTQPKNAIVLNGATATFTVEASGKDLAYQWQISDDGGKTWRADTVKTAVYSAKLTQDINGRRVRCVISDPQGNMVVSDAAAMWLSKLKITQQPADVTVKKGKAAAFSVKANGDGVAYQWQISSDNGENWKNASEKSAKSASYTFTTDDKSNGLLVRCIVSDKYGNKLATKTASVKVQ